MSDAAAARRLIGLLDLTDLSDTADEPGALRLCERAVTPHGPVAAICIWPRFVAAAKAKIGDGGIRIATVANFPDGGEDERAVTVRVEGCLDDGADEIDLVMPYRAFNQGRRVVAASMIASVRGIMPDAAVLKVILEVGALADATRIERASQMALAAGADFIKTSTGKTASGASLDAVRPMLRAIREAKHPAGLKVSGGVRSLAEARAYLDLAEEVMGPGWATPATFRIGASGLLDALIAAASPREATDGAGD